MFACPTCSDRGFATIRGWKHHLTHAHGGYNQEQLDAIVGGQNEGAHLSGEPDLQTAIAGMPETEAGLGPQPSLPGMESPEGEASTEQRKGARAAKKRIAAKMETLKKKLSSDLPAQAFEWAGVTMESEDKQWLGESIETAMEVFGIDFEVEPRNLVIRSPWLILLYPLLVIVIVIVKAFIKQQAEKKEDDAGTIQ